MAEIRVDNLTFEDVFKNVSFSIDSDWKLGLIGRNGKGKTTFLQLLIGKYEYRGNIVSRIPFRYFPVCIPQEDWNQNVIDLMEKEFPDYELWRVTMELGKLDTDADILYRAFGTLSFGERTKVMLAFLFANENNFLLLDEPTNHLDVDTKDMVSKYLNSKKGFILVSHERDLLDSCADHILAINRNSITVSKGNFSTWMSNKEKQDAHELAENENLKKEIKRLESSARQSYIWADKVESTKIGYNPIKEDRNISTRSYIAEKSRRMQQRRKNIEKRQLKQIEEKKGLLKDIEQDVELKLFPLSYRKDSLVKVESVCVSYNGKTVCKDISFDIKNGERVLLYGKNGCGKSTIIKAILGDVIPDSGKITVGGDLIISYVPQDASSIKGSIKDFADRYNIELPLLMSVLRQMDFERVQLKKDVGEYSDGQKKKVLIAASLCTKAHLYIWDEPLNYLDIFSRMQIEKLVLEFKPALLFVEHDKYFQKNVATKSVDFTHHIF